MGLTVAEFVARWQKSLLTERSAAQSHFIDLCEVLGEAHPAAVDQEGRFYTFEKGAAKLGGGKGFADVWKRGFFAWEYKGKHKNLDAAYRQLQQYREDLENPPLLVVCDLDRFIVRTNYTGTATRLYSFDLEDLKSDKPTSGSALPPLEVLRAVFGEPERLRPDRTTAQVTEKAAAEFALLADSLRRRGHDPEEAARFLMRLLFCLFAEDIKLLPLGLFSKLVENTRTRPEEFNRRVRFLFDAMAHGGSFGADDIAHFNGGLFASRTTDDGRQTAEDGATALELTSDDLGILGRASKLDWVSIEPAIFGTLFERSLDPSKRAQLGAHYTSREDILLIVEPVLMEPLRQRWTEVQEEARRIIAKREMATDRAKRTMHQRELEMLLRRFAEEVGRVRVLDPACGSGNFLYVALKRLLDLEKEVSVFAASNGLPGLFPGVDPSQLFGIELNDYAHELASLVVWIGYIQWLYDNGFGVPSSPILKPLNNIRHMDAILAYDEEGRPVEPGWPEAEVIIGNPPFLGGKRLRSELGDAYVRDLFSLYEGRVPREADLVTYWFERSRSLIAIGDVRRAGLLATNSVRNGASRQILEHIKQTGSIFMAWADRPWMLNGAAVRVSMVGFDSGIEQACILDGIPAKIINSDLTGSIDITAASQLGENANISLRADEKGGAFDIPDALAQDMLQSPVNVNGRPNSDVIRQWLTAFDITRRPRNMWIIDFGTDTSQETAAQYEVPFSHVEKHVRPERITNNMPRLREKWWLHRIPGAAMRAELLKLKRYIATPVTSKYRIFTWVASSVLPDITLSVFAREDDYFFGVLHSKLHELWSLRTGATLEDRPRYTPTTTFETFPFPWPPGKEPEGDPRVEAIGEAARELVGKRDAWLNPPGASEGELKKRTLTNLYNERPTWLEMAHGKLDRAVLDAYEWGHEIGDEEILERLLALNLERAAGRGGGVGG